MSGSNSSAHDAAPEPLSFTVHNGPSPTEGAAPPVRARTVGGRLRMLLVLLVCASPVIASYVTYFVIRPEGRSNYGSLIQPSRGLPADLRLSTLDGADVSPRSLRGQWLLVAVGPTACDKACQRRLFTQRQLREMLGRERDRLDKVWLVTDSAPVVPALRAVLAGPVPVQVLRVDRDALARWLAPAEGQALEDHLYLVDPMGEWMMRMPASPEPARVKRDLERVLRASASWDNAGR
jgi:hypothetical protein